MGEQGTFSRVVILICLIFLATSSFAQNDVILQGFHFYVPVDEDNRNGFWWDNLASKSQDLKDAGFTSIWTPPPSKGHLGILDVGYSVFSHFDLGNYDLRGSIETRYGSRAELKRMVDAMHARGIKVYTDVVLNHMTADARGLEVNPVVRNYVMGEADGGTHTAFPTNEIVWRLPGAPAGEYVIQVKGYNLPCSAAESERAYEIYATWTNPDPRDPFYPNIPQVFPFNFEVEPNSGGAGMANEFPASGSRVWGHINYCEDLDEYRITLPQPADINLVLTAMSGDYYLGPGDQRRGYRISGVEGPAGDMTDLLQVLTTTKTDYLADHGVAFTGRGEQNWVWDYTYFHPSREGDYLETVDGTRRIIPRAKLFGNDIDTSDPRAAERLRYWGQWLTNEIGFDGYRLDSVNLFEEDFAASWINSMPRRADGSQRYVVGEFFSFNKAHVREWVDEMTRRGAEVKVFDFNLKYFALNRLANGSSSSFDMRSLNHAGLIRDNTGNSVPASKVVNFAEIHDSAQPGHWLTRDWQLPYAYILFADGAPSVLYAHFYGARLASANQELTTPISLQQDIRKLINIRRQQLEGDMIVLSQNGGPQPANDAANVFVARRRGDRAQHRPGAILVLNNHESLRKCLTVDNSPPGSSYENWAGRTLIDLTGTEPASQVSRNGRVEVCAAPRGYAVYAPVEWANGRASDFDRDGSSDPAVWRPEDGSWHVLDGSFSKIFKWGTVGDRQVTGDYDGDRKTDIAVWRPSNGVWYILQSTKEYKPESAYIAAWGAEGDIPVPADHDGDGRLDLTVFRPSSGAWYVRYSSDGSHKVLNFGTRGDMPMAADFDGDGRADIAVWRPSNGTWHILNSGIEGYKSLGFGVAGDRPVPADFDGDRRTDIAVFRPSSGTWYILGSRQGSVTQLPFGIGEDQPVPSDFDGDGTADIAVWRPSSGAWYVLPSQGGFYSLNFGVGGDVPVRSSSIPD